ncbi:tryptophan halogenase family protein [Alteromonas sp. HB246098]
MSVNSYKNIVIAGGGTAGWMAGVAFAKLLGNQVKVTLIEADDIPTVGVGEATIPSLHVFHDLLKINEAEFMKATGATFKLGIQFDNWYEKNAGYLHSFGYLGKGCWAAGFQHFWLRGQKLGISKSLGDYCVEHLACRVGQFATAPGQPRNYAYHLDATRYAVFLKKLAIENGLHHIPQRITAVNMSEKDGTIESLSLNDNETVYGDLFIDCTGFKGLLIEQALNTGFEDWGHWLPMNSAVVAQTTLTEQCKVPFTRSIAHDAGWRWKIPLQHRTGNGMVYSDKFINDDDAKLMFEQSLAAPPITTPRLLKFKTGTRRQHWNKNCVAIGLSSGFIEPLESTSIHLIQQSIIRLLQLIPNNQDYVPNQLLFNQRMRFEMENIRDFIILHYHATARKDTPFWRFCKGMAVPKSLERRIALFSSSGHVYKQDEELFGEDSWLQVMLGQGLYPKSYHAIADAMEPAELSSFLENIYSQVRRQVDRFPSHTDFIKQYAKSEE